MICNVCGAPGEVIASFANSLTSESRRLPAPSSLEACPCCGMLHSAAQVDWARYYAEEYDAKLSDGGADEIVSLEDGQTVFRTDFDYALFRRHLGDRLTPSTSLFEFGCGRARILSRLHRDGFHDLAAFDLSESYRDGAARFCAERVYIGTRPDLRCDVAYSLFVLEHDVAPVDSLRYLHGVLRPEGLLYVVVPNYQTNVVDLACADHVNHFGPTTLRAVVEGVGFVVETVDDTSSIGSLVLVARRGEHQTVPPSWARLDLVAESRASAGEFVDYLASLRATISVLAPTQPIWLYGAGFYAALVHAEVVAAGHQVAGIFDANPRKAGSIVLGHRVRGADEIASAGLGSAQLLICVNPRIGQSIAERWSPHVGSIRAIGVRQPF